MMLPAAYYAWRYRQVSLRLIVYPAALAILAWLLRPQFDGWVTLAELLVENHLGKFYPSLIVPFAVVGALAAAVFTKKGTKHQ